MCFRSDNLVIGLERLIAIITFLNNNLLVVICSTESLIIAGKE